MTASDVAPTVLLVDSNPMNVLRLTELLQGRGFEVSVCEDGDLAVDEYIRLDPELVVLALDLPSLDGHLAALEMREHGGDERIMFVAPRRMLALAKDAGFSAGAVAVLEKLERTALRVLGPSHPKIPAVRQTLGLARGKLFTDVLPARSRRDA